MKARDFIHVGSKGTAQFKAEPSPYQGSLVKHLPLIFRLHKAGKLNTEIQERLPGEWWEKPCPETIAYVLRRHGLETNGRPPEGFFAARREHAFRLRQKGLSLRAIGARLGVSGQQARILIIKFEQANRRQQREAMKYK